ncbi:LacI family DNA-binding transcriptional regulator [Microbacterium schleiferi]|uniref:LacI family DNA-binding transcriptional regulator n=1 Tax=Microbacterium schleiferi TaxID=69362 RepID=A0ABU7V4K1_9MICO
MSNENLVASVSVKDVAAAAGVSIGTVSNVLNQPERVLPATVARVRAAIAELGYVRNDAARQLRAGRSSSIGLIALDLANPFFAAVAKGAQERAAEAGLFVLVAASEDTRDREMAYLDHFSQQRVVGVLVTPASGDPDALKRLEAAGVRIVLVDRDAGDAPLNSVSVDDEEGGYLAVSHLLSIGRRRVVFVGGPSTLPQVLDRFRGARRAASEVADSSLEHLETAELTVLAGREAAAHILERDAADRPDAVFCANDLVAVGMLQGLAILGGVRVPDDIALVGYDDIDFATATVVPLTSVRQPAVEIGRAAVELVLEQGEQPQPRQVRFTPELIIRESSRATLSI